MFVALLTKKNYMKKILFLLMVSSFVIAAKAQFGFNAGINISSMHGSDVDNSFKSKIGFHAGAFYNIAVANSISVQTEASYSGEGAKVDADGESGKYELGYLNIAALFRYNFQGGFNLGTGPQYGFLLSAKAKGSGQTVDIKDQMKSGNFSWAFAAGYDLPMGVGFYGRYNLGLSKIVDETGVDVKASSFQIGVRYTINKGEGKSKSK